MSILFRKYSHPVTICKKVAKFKIFFFLIFWRQLTFAFRFNQKMHPSFKVRDLSNTFRFSAFGQILICSMYINIIMDHFWTQALKQSVIILPSKNRHYTIHTSKINDLRSSLTSEEMLQNFLHLYKKKTQVVFLFCFSLQVTFIFTLWMPWSLST